MMVWIIILLFAAILLIAVIGLGKLPRKIWEIAAAAIILGLAGYAVQGMPNLAGAPAQPVAANGKTAAALILTRSEMDRSFSAARPYLIAADALSRSGDYRLAAAYIKSGIRKNPGEADLWAGLALQLMLASDGKMSPPAKFAFDKTRALNPQHPAPDYFTGLVRLFDGRPDETLRLWQGLIDKAPKQARWKKRLESQVDGVKSLLSAARLEDQNDSDGI